MVVECVLNCPLARNALEAVVPHRPGVDALGMITGGAVLQSDAGMYFCFLDNTLVHLDNIKCFSDFKPIDTFF